MISIKTKKYYSHMVNKAHALKIYSFSIKHDHIYIDKSSLTVKCVTSISLLVNAGIILYFMLLGLFLTSNMQVTILFLTMASILFFCLGCQIWHFAFIDEIPQVLSQLFDFFNRLRKFTTKLMVSSLIVV